MNAYAEIAKLHNQRVLTDVGHSALPNAPIQPYNPRRQRSHDWWSALSRRRWTTRPAPSGVQRVPA
jgi:hypothetical protein